MGFELPVPGLVEVVVGDGLRLSGIERRGLVEVARGVARFCGFGFEATEIELYLGWPACGMEWGRSCGLTDVGENPADGLGLGQERD